MTLTVLAICAICYVAGLFHGYAIRHNETSDERWRA